MGNEQSQLSGLEIEEKAIEVTDFWSHHLASINFGNVNCVSVFIGEELIGGSLWIKQTPLEKLSKNLMIYRHPCILKYISSWQKDSKFYLAVEDVKPLFQVLPSQNNLQLCVGLYSILKALCFLHDKALASHNNVCTASIYITKDGNWKLGGMEYLCKFADMTQEYLGKARNHRYDRAVDPNEDKHLQVKSDRIDFVDVYAFGTLVIDIIKKKNEDIPSLDSFLDLCRNGLQNVNILLRPKLSELLDHPYFNHDFIVIHCFLTELPLRTDIEKMDFFLNLANKLRTFDEITVASQLGSLLLSRMVLLNKAAQSNFIPFVLCPREDSLTNSSGLFSMDVFREYLIPKLLEIFCVRDAQIRFLLLDHFGHYMNCFTNEELQSQILPELLVGIKDTNDHLVAITLRALADLVPILGSSTVIGGKRAKLFNDGRPIVHSTRRSRKNSKRNQDTVTLDSTSRSSPNIIEPLTTVSAAEANHSLELSERPSPDGEEGETSTEGTEVEAEEDLDNWEDWGINDDTASAEGEGTELSALTSSDVTENERNWNSDTDLQNELQNIQISISSLNVTVKKKSLPDIAELDIKNQRNSASKFEEFDFFQDMEPVIETSKFSIDSSVNIDEQSGNKNIPKKLNLGVVSTENHVEGWGDDLDWD